MKVFQTIMLLVILLATAACQGAATPAPDTQPLGDPNQAIEEVRSYPAPDEQVVNSAYPAPSEAELTVDWQEVSRLAQAGQIVRISAGDGQLTLYLRSGKFKYASEPEANALQSLLDACGQQCSEIQVVSE